MLNKQLVSLDPASKALPLCIFCQKRINPSWLFCPGCGADNRAPEKRQEAISNHNHEFRFGSHCVICGAAAQTTVSGAVLSNGILFSRNLSNRACGAIAVLVSIALGTDQYMKGHTDFVALASVGMAFGLLYLLSDSRTSIDVERREASWSKGIWPIFIRGKCSLDECLAFEMYSVRSRRYWSFRLSLLRADGSRIFVDQESNYRRLALQAQELSAATHIPFHDEVQPFLRPLPGLF